MDRSAADPGWAQARVSHGNGTTVASRGRWLSRGTGHGTGRGEIRVQSAFPLRSAVLYVQVMLWERGSGPLVMRCWLVSAGCHRCCQPRSSGLGPYVRTVKTKSGATAVQVVYLSRRGLAISGRQLAHDLLRRVLLPRSHVDAGPSCPQRGPQDSQTTWIKDRRRQRWCHRHSRMDIYQPAGPGRPYPHQRGRHRRAPGPGS